MGDASKFRDVCGDTLRISKTKYGNYQFITFGEPELAEWQVKEVIQKLQEMLNEKVV